MNKAFLYLSVSFLGLASLFNSKANDSEYSSPNISPESPKYLTPAPLGTTQFSDLPTDLKGYISRDLTDLEIGRLSQTNKQNHREFNNSDFYTGYGQTKEQRFSQA